MFNNIQCEILSLDNSNLKDNEYYNVKYIENFIKKNLSIISLWSVILNKDHNRLSNSVVENSFRFLKHEMLKGQTNVKPGRFVDMQKIRAIASAREVLLSLPVGENANVSPPKKRRRRSGGNGSR